MSRSVIDGHACLLQADWNDDGGEMGVCRYPDSPLRLFLANYLALALAVIPAQAGIQWFIQAIPAQRE